MTLDNFGNQFNSFARSIRSGRAAVALKVAFDLSALIKLRIQTTGHDSNNNAFLPYTPYSVSLRRKKGYQTAYVDFTQTGRMFANVLPQVVSDNENETIIQITARSSSEQAKLQKQVAKRGNILTPSKQEIAIATSFYISQIKNKLTFK